MNIDFEHIVQSFSDQIKKIFFHWSKMKGFLLILFLLVSSIFLPSLFGLEDLDEMKNYGVTCFEKNLYKQSKEAFLDCLAKENDPNIKPLLLLFAAYAAEKDNTQEEAKLLKFRILEEYPKSLEAEEAYFNLFPYQDYLIGEKTALKHLNQLAKTYPNSIYCLNASLLIGLDLKKNKRSISQDTLKKKQLFLAIDQFQEVENCFQRLYMQGKIPEDKIEYYLLVRYRARLEKALSFLFLSQDADEKKKSQFLDYAKDLLISLEDELDIDKSRYKKWISSYEPFWYLYEEAMTQLAAVYIEKKDFLKAKKILTTLLEKYEKAQITKGYFLSRTITISGQIAFLLKDFSQALDLFKKAEIAAKGKILTDEQKLELWIYQSICYKELKNYDTALLILSKVINDEATCPLRIKAMHLRADIYKLQGRFDVAKKQLEAAMLKGGQFKEY